MYLPQVQVIDEGYVIDGVPVEGVENSVEGHSVKELVNRLDHFGAVVAGCALFDVQRAGDKVVLHVHDEKGALRTRADLYPAIPAYLRGEKSRCKGFLG